MEEFCCLDCKKETTTVVDYRTGDTICTECGLVLESHYIDETSEWRIFTEDSDAKDPSRVGGATNPFLPSNTLATVISNSTPGSKPVAHSLNRLQNLEPDPGQGLLKGFQAISTMAEKLGLNSTIKSRAHEIFAKMSGKRPQRSKTLVALFAACVFTACRELKLSRTLREIATVAEGASMKEINKAVIAIKREVGVQLGTVDTGELVRRFCSDLGMTNEEVKAVQEAVQKAKEFDIRRNPKSVLAVIICMVAQLADGMKIPIRDITRATDVAEVTIKKTYKDIYPYASRLIPSWYAKQQDINQSLFLC